MAREKSAWDSLEIPQGKRTLKYRFFEILPWALSTFLIVILFVLSVISPALGSVYLLIIITTTLVKAVGVAYRTIQGYNVVKKAEKVDWHQRYLDLFNPHEAYENEKGKTKREFGTSVHLQNLLTLASEEGQEVHKYPDPKDIYHAVLVMAYNEGIEILGPSIKAVADTHFDSDKIIMVLGYEERGGEEMEKTAKLLKEKYGKLFHEFILAKHPDGVPGEIKGKGPNLCNAGKALEEYCKKKRIPVENVIVTSLDSDNRMSPEYLDYVAYEFVMHPNRQRLSYQPVSLFMNNIWDASAPMRVIAISNSFFNVISTMRPHTLKNFASHSQPLAALIDMDFWSKRTIVEDGHQYWRSLFHFHGDYEVLPIHVAIYQDAVMEETFLKTLKAQFIQLRRWDYGASDVAYVGVRLFDRKLAEKGKMAFLPLLAKFIRLLEGHVMLAAMSPIVAFGGWVPRLMNNDSKDLMTYNLPNTVSIVQTVAAIGLMITIVMSLRMIPPKPKNRKIPKIVMVLQWVLMPIIAIVYQSAAAFYSQTRLAFGRYMEKFDVTKKIVKH